MQYREAIRCRIDTALFLMNELFVSLAPLYQENCGREQEITVPLFTMLHSTSSTILTILNEEMALPDADVLLRTVMEGTVKYCYLLNGTPEERSVKYEEYRYALYGMEMVSDHKKAMETLRIFEEFSIENSTIPFEASVLPEDFLKAIQSQYTKKQKTKSKINGLIKLCYVAWQRIDPNIRRNSDRYQHMHQQAIMHILIAQDYRVDKHS